MSQHHAVMDGRQLKRDLFHLTMAVLLMLGLLVGGTLLLAFALAAGV